MHTDVSYRDDVDGVQATALLATKRARDQWADLMDDESADLKPLNNNGSHNDDATTMERHTTMITTTEQTTMVTIVGKMHCG